MKFFANQAGGYQNVGYILKDLYNHLDAERRVDINDGDAVGALAYLSAKKDSDPLFFYDYDVDEEKRLCKLIWADSRSQADYKIFGDLLVFDTTYRSNAYHKPLVIFAGINNHYMTTIFACALLSDENEGTYVWVLEKLIECMEGKKPVSVLTDGDNAMRKAIETVFPEARHRLCSWHLQRNIPNNIASEDFRDGFVRCMHKVCFKDEFDKTWNQLITENGVREISWVQEIFKKREKWAEAYLRGHFWGNMSCTQRCEGMHAFLKQYLDVKLRLYEFVRSFDLALAWLRHTEAKAIAIAYNSSPVLSTHLQDFEAEVDRLCTRNIFFKIQEEIHKEAKLLSRMIEESGAHRIYEVTLYSNRENVWIVRLNRDALEFKCSCLQFETVGWPCALLFAIFKAERMPKFPRNCINVRWTRDVKKDLQSEHGSSIPRSVAQIARFGVLSSMCNPMCYYASLCDEGYEELEPIIIDLTERMKQISEKWTNNKRQKCIPTDANRPQFDVCDPVISATKGSGAKGVGSKPTPRRCSNCRCIGHNKTTCRKEERTKRTFKLRVSESGPQEGPKPLFVNSIVAGSHESRQPNQEHIMDNMSCDAPREYTQTMECLNSDFHFQAGSSFSPSNLHPQIGSINQWTIDMANQGLDNNVRNFAQGS